MSPVADLSLNMKQARTEEIIEAAGIASVEVLQDDVDVMFHAR